jgi:hypothetical protein
MLLGAMALAYGLLYRGMFRDLDYAARAVIECDQRIEELLAPPSKDEPGRAEQREIERVLADYRTRRQYVLDLDRERRLRRVFLTSDEGDTTMLAAYQVAASVLWKVWIRLRRIGPQPDFYRVTDFEAAPVETAERQHFEELIRQADLELKLLDPEAARARKEMCEREYEIARQEREAAERRQPLAVASSDEREAEERLAFEDAFAVGLSTRPAYDVIVKRRDEHLRVAERPRVKRPVRPRAEEVQDGH